MASIDTAARVSKLEGAVSRVMAPRRQRVSIGRILGGFLLTGVFLALSAAAFPLAAVYGFVWFAQHYSL
ncbi:MAG TPA: hypothetical protein VHX19_24340 [Stellaceae bacterium]|jgi:hypothetical protein|nr:hypothetical protein [Stellaceae bacterium]